MSVFNGDKYLKESIKSILNQTYENFEFIIVDDNSIDNSLNTILSFNDPRIKVIKNKKNIGLAGSLNKALKVCKGEYIARMDHDDIAYNNRLEKQFNYLESNPKIGLLGTYALLFGNKKGTRKNESESDLLKVKTMFSCQFSHPTVMIRKEVMDKHDLSYNENFKTAQDYELWSRMIDKTEFGTLPIVLLKYRNHNKQISITKKRDQEINTDKIHFNLLTKIGLEPTKEILEIHSFLEKFPHRMSFKEINSTENYLIKILNANDKTGFLNQESLFNFFSEYFYNICKKSKGNSIKRCYLFSKSLLAKNNKIRWKKMKILTSFLLIYQK